MLGYEEYCKQFMKDKIADYIGTEIYMCDLGYELTETINVNGTATFSRSKAKEYIKEWFYEAGKVFDYQVENYGKAMQNPFENPEGWMVCMIIEGVNSLITQCECVGKLWNDKVELTTEIADKICREIDDLSIDFLD